MQFHRFLIPFLLLAAFSCTARQAGPFAPPKRGDALWRSDATPAREAKLAEQMGERALLLMKNGDLEGAEEWARKGILADPDAIQGYLRLGEILERAERFYDSENEYSVALLKAPRDREPFERLFAVFLAQGKHAEARRALARYATPLGEFGHALLSGILEEREGRVEAALRLYARAAGLAASGPNAILFFDAHRAFAALASRSGQAERALAKIVEATDLARSRKTEGETYLRSRLRAPMRPLGALEAEYRFMAGFQELSKRLDQPAAKESEVARDLTDFEMKNAARRRNTNNLAVPDEAISVAWLRARYAERFSTGLTRSIHDLQTNLVQFPWHVPSWLLLARLQVLTRAYPAAWQTLDEGERQAPGETGFIRLRADLASRSGNPLAERLSLERLVARERTVSPIGDRRGGGERDSRGARLRLADHYFRFGAYERAAQLLTEEERSAFPRLSSLRDLQFAFQGLKGASLEDRATYLVSIRQNDPAMVLWGLSRLYRGARQNAAAARYLADGFEALWTRDAPPPYILTESAACLEEAAQLGPEAQAAAARLKEQVDRRYGSAMKCMLIGRVRAGEVDGVGSVEARADEESLTHMLRLAWVTADPEIVLSAPLITGRLLAMGDRAAHLSWHLYPRMVASLESVDAGDLPRALALLDELTKERQARAALVDSNAFSLDFAVLRERFDQRMAVQQAVTGHRQRDWEKIASLRARWAGSPWFHEVLVEELLARDRSGEGMRIARAAAVAFPESSGLYYQLARCHLGQNSVASGLAAIRWAINLSPEVPSYYALESRLLSRARRYPEALASLRAGTRRCGADLLLRQAEGELAFAAGDFLAALERFKTLTQEHPGLVDAWHNAGLSALHAGRNPEALFYFQRALLLFPDSEASRFHLARVRLRLGDLPGAREELERYLVKVPGDAWASCALGHVLEKSMARAEPADFKVLIRSARTAYAEAMSGSRYYSEPHRWAQNRLSVLSNFDFTRKREALGAPVRFEGILSGVHQDGLLVALENSRVEFWDLRRFQKKWSVALDAPAIFSPVANGPYFTVATATGRIYFLTDAGAIRGLVRLQARPAFPPVYQSPFFLFPCEQGTIEVMQDRQTLGSIRFPAPLSTPPALDGTRVWVGLANGTLACADLFSRKILKSVKLGGVPSGTVRVRENTVYVGSEDNRYYAIDTRTGTVDYAYLNDAPATAFQRPYPYQMLYGTADGRARLVDAMGRFYWEWTADGSFSATPWADNELTLFPLETGAVSATGVADGKWRWTVRLDSPPAAPPVFVDNDLLAVCTRRGYLYQIYLNDENGRAGPRAGARLENKAADVTESPR